MKAHPEHASVDIVPSADNFFEAPEEDEVFEVYTGMGVEFARENNYFEPADELSELGYFKGRFMIGRDTPINHGVWIDGLTEAIVVDDSVSPQIWKTYDDLLERISVDGRVDRGKVLETVQSLVAERLPYDLSRTLEIAKPFQRCKKVSLGLFMQKRAGVCRHQALLAGYLLERLVDDGRIRGHASVRRNIVKGFGGHAWAEYQNATGERYVIDPAQNFLGTKEEASSRASFHVFHRRRWRY